MRLFSLGQVNGRLVAVGGELKEEITGSCVRYCNDKMYVLNESSNKWNEEEIPSMPTARLSPAVLCLRKALIVAGGDPGGSEFSNAVEIFKPADSQWYRTNPLPITAFNMSFVGMNREKYCYALGGYKGLCRLNHTLQASFDDLLLNAVPADEKLYRHKASPWKELSRTPAFRPAAAVLGDSLFAIGGSMYSDVQDSTPHKGVYKYTPSTNTWDNIGDLPAPRSSTTVAVISPAEILVIGGKDGVTRVKSVYKGTYHN